MAAQELREALADPVPRNVWGIVVGAVGVLVIISVVFRDK